MAIFQEKQISFGDINGGIRYADGDIPNAEAFNAPIEASFWAQEKAKEAETKANAAFDKVQGALGSSSAFSLLDAYPVGAIYMSNSPSSPASLFGGIWARIKDCFILAAGDKYAAGATGGSADAVVVSHTHTLSKLITGDGGIQVDGATVQRGYVGSSESNIANLHPEKYSISETGESATGANMPPYLAVYMWQRTG